MAGTMKLMCAPVRQKQRANAVREEQRIVATLASKQLQGRFSARPNRLHMSLEPGPELKSVKLSLVD